MTPEGFVIDEDGEDEYMLPVGFVINEDQAAGGDGTDISWPAPVVPPVTPTQVVGY